jgi:hypothetical protein
MAQNFYECPYFGDEKIKSTDATNWMQELVNTYWLD